MLGVTALKKSFGGSDLFEDVSFRLEKGEKAALVGVNGSGKSTLMRMCAGQIPLDGGEISLPRDAAVGYLPQHAELNTGRTLFEELRAVFANVDSHFEECEQLAHRMGEVAHDSEEYHQIADRYGHLQHEIDRLGAYEIDSRIEKIMAGLGFKASDRDKPCSAFSGGWQMRIMLGALLLTNPDVLLLDEPTNHLDLETMIWLENWIRESDASVLLVSHERKFMDALANRVLEVHEGKLTVYRGNYTDYLKSREERWAQWQREYDNQQDEIAHLRKFIDRFRYNASKAALVQSRIRALEKIVPIPPPPKAAASIRFRFPAPDRGSKEVFAMEGVAKSFGDHRVLSGVDVGFWRGEKIALVGLNGAGKTTLLKMLGGVEQPSDGTVRAGVKTRAEYFAQYDHDGMSKENTVWQEIASVAPVGHLEQARALLGGFFFSGDDADKPIHVLSGGERTRVRLAKMLFSGANALLLDEPTNHLDIASRATLENAVKDYEGTVIFVSHDRAFLDAVATRVLEIKGGRVRSFPGNYTDYCHALRAMGEESPLIGETKSFGMTRDSSGADGQGGLSGKKENAKPASPAPSKASDATQSRNPLSQESAREQTRIKKLVAQIEKQIAETEVRLKEIETELAKPEVYKDFRKSNPLVGERDKLQSNRDTYLAQWERHAATLEA